MALSDMVSISDLIKGGGIWRSEGLLMDLLCTMPRVPSVRIIGG